MPNTPDLGEVISKAEQFRENAYNIIETVVKLGEMGALAAHYDRSYGKIYLEGLEDKYGLSKNNKNKITEINYLSITLRERGKNEIPKLGYVIEEEVIGETKKRNKKNSDNPQYYTHNPAELSKVLNLLTDLISESNKMLGPYASEEVTDYINKLTEAFKTLDSNKE